MVLHNWEDLHDVLIPQYPDFPREPLPLTSRKTVVSGTSGEIRISWQSTGATIAFHGLPSAPVMLPELEELAMLRQVTDNISFPA